MNQDIKNTFKYFSFFSYAPTFEELYWFYPKKISKKNFKRLLLDLEQKNKIISFRSELASFGGQKRMVNRYLLNTVGEYSIKKFEVRNKISQKKLSHWRFRLYIKLLTFFPQIKLVGLSGSIAMMNAKEEDDIDLFIITAKNRLFTARFIAIILAKILGIHRGYQNIKLEKFPHFKNFKNKVCLNLFFEEKNLKIPLKKHSLYVAHELLQMKPLVSKDNIYERFLKSNQWIFSLFPNARKTFPFKFLIANQFQNSRSKIKNFADWLENQLKKFQLKLIRRHQTKEFITDHQLWFHPNDFERKIERIYKDKLSKPTLKNRDS